MNNEDKVILISGCLVGIACRYDGMAKEVPEVLSALKGFHLIPFCPETLGGLVAPRPPAEIVGGDGAAVLDGMAKVLSRTGEDCTAAFIRGAVETLELVKEINPYCVLLKARSPSCGVGRIYDGTFSGKLIEGDGVTTALLRRHGVKVYTEEQILNNQKMFF